MKNTGKDCKERETERERERERRTPPESRSEDPLLPQEGNLSYSASREDRFPDKNLLTQTSFLPLVPARINIWLLSPMPRKES